MKVEEIVLGIDIGGTTTAFGFVNGAGTLLVQGEIPTQAQEPAALLIARLRVEIDKMRAGLSPELQWQGIGIGAPNANYLRGTVENPPNLQWGASTNLVELFQRAYDLPIAITNDANAAALGEMHFGAARGMKDFIVITLGTGLGSGIVVNGELVYGASGFAGELGHTVVDPQGRDCACGKKGCLETYVSAPGLCRTALDLLDNVRESNPLRDLNRQQITAKEISSAARSGNPVALEAFEQTARILGMKLADAVAHTAPEAIFLLGGLAAAGDLLLTPTRRYMEEFLFTPYRGRVRLALSEVSGGGSAIIGAAALLCSERERSHRVCDGPVTIIYPL